MPDPLYSKAHVRASLLPQASDPDDDLLWLAGASSLLLSKIRAAVSRERVPAAVLVPLVDRAAGMTVLLTQRAATLTNHAGQISFPGGRIEPDDADPWRRGAARDA